MAAADAIGFPVLDSLHIRAVAAAIAPRSMAWEIRRDEDGLARVGNDPVHLGHVGRKGADLLGGQVVEDRTQVLGKLAAVADREDGEERTEHREEQAEHLERRAVLQVPIVGLDEGLQPPGFRRHAAMLAAGARKPDVGASGRMWAGLP